MEMTSTRGRLVDTPVPGAEPLEAIISRAEIESALSADQPAELVLDVRRNNEQGTVSVVWEKADLERLLSSVSTDAVTFSFDPAELVGALDEPDVEGHGLREKALVLTVFAAAATAGASSAMAAPDVGTGGRSIAAQQTAGEASMVDRGIEVQRAAATEASSASMVDRGVDVQRAAAASEESLASIVDRGVDVQRAASASEPSEASLASMVDRGVEVQRAAAASEASLASMVDRGVDMQRAAADQPAPSDGGWSIDMPSVDPTSAAVAGGLAGGALLLITAAGFSVRRNRSARPV